VDHRLAQRLAGALNNAADLAIQNQGLRPVCRSTSTSHTAAPVDRRECGSSPNDAENACLQASPRRNDVPRCGLCEQHFGSSRGCVFGSPNVGRSYLRRPDPAEWQMLVLGKALIPE
jgi:hypothetical protein